MIDTPTAPYVTLPRSGLVVPRIGIGLAHLHHLAPDRRARLIDTAMDLGLTHFDTARFYSDGMSERALGTLLRGRRSRVTITTKFGLLPTPLIGQLGPLAPLGRKARSAFVRLGLTHYPRQLYTPALLRQSIAASLRALRTDHIDILAIHEPSGAGSLSDELIDALVAVKRAGMARFIGVAGDTIDTVIDRWGDQLDIIQTGEAKWHEGGHKPDFTYSLFSVGRGRGEPPLAQAEIDARLRRALDRRPAGAVLVQTRDPDRLRNYVAVAAA